MEKKTVTPEIIKQAGELLKREHEERVRLEKQASESVLEKRAQKLAFREIELGISEPFKTHEEFTQKVASLMQENLDIVETALERGYGNSRRTGELSDGETNKKGRNPFEQFVWTGELDSE